MLQRSQAQVNTMPALPFVDINLFVHNSATVVDDAIESVLAQTWPNINLTLIDDGSTDNTLRILQNYAAEQPRIHVKRNRCNGGAIPAFQRAFWYGDADYLVPKSGDDVIAPDFVQRLMAELLAHPECAMCHAAGLIFRGGGEVLGRYPPEHCLEATDTDPRLRSVHVMTRYTSSPSFWGVYRRAAVDRLSPIRYRAGWDHVLLAELALHGEIRHVAEPLYWRRDGGKPVLQLARSATEQGCRGVPLEDELAEQSWRTPLITTAYAHIEMFAAARLALKDRLALMRAVPDIFRARWLSFMQGEAAALQHELPALLAQLKRIDGAARWWQARAIAEALVAAQTMVPEVDNCLGLLELTALASEPPEPIPAT
jgi:glycosyltransferase involved in cell wall biosynthesis